MEKTITIKIGDKRLHHIRLFIKSLENRGLIKPIRVMNVAYTTMFGDVVLKDDVFIHKYYKLGSYDFKVVEWA